MKKQLLMGTLAAAVMAGAAVPAFADDGLSAYAGAASMYLWRGTDLGSSNPEVFGDLNYSLAGFYGDAWISSGNFSEYDLSLGYKVTVSDIGLDIGAVNYNYSGTSKSGMSTLGDATEAYVKVSAMGATLSYYNAVSTTEDATYIYGNNDAGLTQGGSYTSLSYALGQFTGLVGHVNNKQGANDYTHIDLTYAYNDKLSFTASQIVDQTDGAGIDDSTKFVVSYSFPMK